MSLVVGNITDRSGNPIAVAIRFSLIVAGAATALLGSVTTAFSRADGRFEVPLAQGTYRVDYDGQGTAYYIAVPNDSLTYNIEVLRTAAAAAAGSSAPIASTTVSGTVKISTSDPDPTVNTATESARLAHYTHSQPSPAALWTINHNLGRRPNVTCFEPGGGQVIGVVAHTDANTATVAFASSYQGTAYCN